MKILVTEAAGLVEGRTAKCQTKGAHEIILIYKTDQLLTFLKDI